MFCMRCIIRRMVRNWHRRRYSVAKRATCKWWKVCRLSTKDCRRAQAKKWANEILKRKWNASEWKRKRPKRWPLLLDCSYCVGFHFSPCIWCAHFAINAYHRCCSQSYFGWATVIRPSIQWFMLFSRKIFDSHLNASFASASARDRVSRVSPADAVQICHNCEPVAERPAYRRALLQIHLATIVIKRPKATKADDDHLRQALVQRLVLARDKIHSTNRPPTRYAIHWSWNHRRIRTAAAQKQRP